MTSGRETHDAKPIRIDAQLPRMATHIENGGLEIVECVWIMVSTDQMTDSRGESETALNPVAKDKSGDSLLL